MSYGRRRSKPSVAFVYLGNWKSGSIVAMFDDRLVVAPGAMVPLGRTPSAHLVGGVVMFAWVNAGAIEDVTDALVSAALLHVSDAKPLKPELPKAFER